VADASGLPNLSNLLGVSHMFGKHDDPTAEAAEALIGLQDSHVSSDSSIMYTALTLNQPDPPDLSDDTDSPAVTDDDTQYDSSGECYIAVQQALDSNS